MTQGSWTRRGSCPSVSSSPACQQLVHQDSQRPVVRRHIVTFVEDDLWSDILWGSTEGPCLLAEADLLGKPKIHLEVSPKSQFYYRIEEISTGCQHAVIIKPVLSDESRRTSLAYPWLSSMRFSGFRSLYMMPLACR